MAADHTKPLGSYARLLRDYTTDGQDGQVTIKQGEEYLILKKTPAAWHVIKNDKREVKIPPDYLTEVPHSNAHGGPVGKKGPPPKPPAKPQHLVNRFSRLPTPEEEKNVLSELDSVLDSVGDGFDIENGTVNDIVAESEKYLEKHKCATLPRVENSSPKDSFKTNSLKREPIYDNIKGNTVISFPDGVSKKPEDAAGNVSGSSVEEDPGFYEPPPDYPTEEEDQTQPSVATASHPEQQSKKEVELPDYVNLDEIREVMNIPQYNALPKVPQNATPIKTLVNGWQVYLDAESQRQYFYNPESGETSWKPPRGLKSSVDSTGSSTSSNTWPKRPEVAATNSFNTTNSLSRLGSQMIPLQENVRESKLPEGWAEQIESGQMVFVNDYSDDKWMSHTDEIGRPYYYSNRGETSWDLPAVPSQRHQSLDISMNASKRHAVSKAPSARASWAPTSAPPKIPSLKSPSSFANLREEQWGDCFDEPTNMSGSSDTQASTGTNHTQPPRLEIKPVERRGMLHRTKFMDNDGKKVKKSWCQSYVVTTGPSLFFYKDERAAQAKPQQRHGKPEVSFDLYGARVQIAGHHISSKRNVIQIILSDNSQYLLQSESQSYINEWLFDLKQNINSVPEQTNSCSVELGGAIVDKRGEPGKKQKRIISTPTSDDTLSSKEKTNRWKDFMSRWLAQRRPTLNDLQKIGIYKNSNIFGSHLQTIAEREKKTIPLFVRHCVAAIEKRGLTSDGLYRVSGNLAEIQKLRFTVDQTEKYDLFSEEWDVTVLSGGLKLFFRELIEPLIPFKLFDKFLAAGQLRDGAGKLKTFKELISALPVPNKDTLQFLLGHLDKVLKESKNRMHTQSLAIVFGPTLMRPEKETANVSVTLIQQCGVVDFMIQESKNLF